MNSNPRKYHVDGLSFFFLAFTIWGNWILKAVLQKKKCCIILTTEASSEPKQDSKKRILILMRMENWKKIGIIM